MFNNFKYFVTVGKTLAEQVLLLQREIEYLRAEAQELEEYAEWAYEEYAEGAYEEEPHAYACADIHQEWICAHAYACADIHQEWICAVARAYDRGCCQTLVEDILTCPYGLGDF